MTSQIRGIGDVLPAIREKVEGQGAQDLGNSLSKQPLDSNHDVTMKIDRVRYNRPGAYLENMMLTPFPTPRDNCFTPTQRLYINDYITVNEAKSPGCHQVRDQLLAHLNIAMTDKERAMICKKGPTYSVRQKILGNDRNVPVIYHTRPLGSLVVRQISPCPPGDNRRPNTADPTSPAPSQKGKSREIKYRKTGLFSRFQLVSTDISFNESQEQDSATPKSQKSVHFAEKMPTVKPDAFNINGIERHCGCGCHRQAVNEGDGKCCACTQHKSEMVLPKIDLSSAIEDGVRATVHAILANSNNPSRSYLSPKEQAVMTLLSTRELGGKQPEVKKIPRRLQPRKSPTPHKKDSDRQMKPSCLSKKRQDSENLSHRKHTDYKPTLMDTQAVPDSLLIGFDRPGGEKHASRAHSAGLSNCDGRESVKPKNFHMALPT